MKHVLITTLLAAALVAPAHAQQSATEHASHGNSSSPGAAAQSEGEVRKIDREAQKITLRHGPITNLGMPPMTMVFQVDNPALLDKINTGDRVKFTADKIGGAFVVRNIEKEK